MTVQAPPGPAQPQPAAPPPAPKRAGLRNRLGVWFFAAVCIVVLPLFPVLVEWVKKGKVEPETYLLTAAVLAAGYGFSSQGNFFRAIYSLIFLASLGYDYNPQATLPLVSLPGVLAGIGGWIMHHFALSLMLLAAMLHTIERFMWHVVLDRLFPDWRQGG